MIKASNIFRDRNKGKQLKVLSLIGGSFQKT